MINGWQYLLLDWMSGRVYWVVSWPHWHSRMWAPFYGESNVSGWTGNENSKLTILVATSGDTGSGCWWILSCSRYWSDHSVSIRKGVIRCRKSNWQHWEKNITASGNSWEFWWLPASRKTAFSIHPWKEKYRLSSANSISIAFDSPEFLLHRCMETNAAKSQKARLSFLFCSGNFEISLPDFSQKRMGLPVEMFIAANNANHPVEEYLKRSFNREPTITTISNAMDVGFLPISYACWICKEENVNLMKGYTSISFFLMMKREKQWGSLFFKEIYPWPTRSGGIFRMEILGRIKQCGAHGIVLETAHPAKFIDVVERP